MATAFSRSLRALAADGSRRSAWGGILAVALLATEVVQTSAMEVLTHQSGLSPRLLETPTPPDGLSG